MNPFKDRVAIITGGAAGLGRALCDELSRRGAVSIVADINMEGAGQTASNIRQAGGRARAAHVDVSRADSVNKMINKVYFEYGRLDYLFNNAGVIIGGEVRDMSLEYWHRIVDVNLLGVIYCTTTAYSLMVKQGYGHIVNISSLSGLTSLPIYTAYATTKHAIIGLSTSLRAEASDLNIKVSAVCPGAIKTSLGDTSILLKIDRKKVHNRLPKMDSTLAAREILRGVTRNRAIIVFPFYSRLLWWIYRLQPALLSPLESRIVRRLRRARFES